MASSEREITLHSALAIRAISRSRYEYNLGVLSVLGYRDLAIAHQMASVAVTRLKDEIEAGEQNENRGVPWPEGARDATLLALSNAITHEEHTWEPIQALIDSVPNMEEALFQSSSQSPL